MAVGIGYVVINWQAAPESWTRVTVVTTLRRGQFFAHMSPRSQQRPVVRQPKL